MALAWVLEGAINIGLTHRNFGMRGIPTYYSAAESRAFSLHQVQPVAARGDAGVGHIFGKPELAAPSTASSI
jgi:hypothetical protein